MGPLPEGAQKITTFSAGIASAAPEPGAARALVDFLRSDRASAEIEKAGLTPRSVR